MPLRYFKATNGRFTVFRASTSRVYKSATIRVDRHRKRGADGKTWVPVGEPVPVYIGFSGSTPPANHPVEEITKAEYEALVARKIARTDAIKAADPALWRTYGHSPQESWVSNDEALS